jgi:sorting nexin-29
VLISSVGFRQGDPMSCLICNLAMEKVIRDSGAEYKGAVYNKCAQILSHADDIVR